MKILNKTLGIISFCLIVASFTIIQGYWALWDYRTAPSSSCLDCDIFSDLLFSSCFPLVILSILQLIFKLMKLKYTTKSIISTVTLIICWIIIDTEIFNEREASWSTYTNVWTEGIALALLPTITLGILFATAYYYFNFKSEL